MLGGLHTRKVNYLSQTYEGKRHDKKIVDEESPTYPVDISLYKDTGFQGYEPEGVQTFQPQKKPKGKELTPEQGFHVRRDKLPSIAYSEELISFAMSTSLQSTDRHHGIVGQKRCYFQLDS